MFSFSLEPPEIRSVVWSGHYINIKEYTHPIDSLIKLNSDLTSIKPYLEVLIEPNLPPVHISENLTFFSVSKIWPGFLPKCNYCFLRPDSINVQFQEDPLSTTGVIPTGMLNSLKLEIVKEFGIFCIQNIFLDILSQKFITSDLD